MTYKELTTAVKAKIEAITDDADRVELESYYSTYGWINCVEHYGITPDAQDIKDLEELLEAISEY